MIHKRVETILKHDRARADHIALIEKKESKYAQTLDKKLGNEIKNLYLQLEYYDKEVLNVKSNVYL